jgi:hypothetical protein
MIKVLGIFSNILGLKSVTRTLVHSLDSNPSIQTQYVLIENEDYGRYPAPFWARLSHPWQAQHIAREKLKAAKPASFDVMIVNAWELMVSHESLARTRPAIAVLDSVPVTIDRQQRDQGRQGWKRNLAHAIHHRTFAKYVSQFDFFLPLGSDCAESLVTDYGVKNEQIALMLAPKDLNQFGYGNKQPRDHFRLLFIGNDFLRKGGEFLLQLFTERLADRCTLTIVSNDPLLRTRALPAGVELLTRLQPDGISKVCRESDLFLFPTQQDYLPQVLAEALASGLPCIANDVGGVKDLVRNDETGYLMPTGASMDSWMARIEPLIANPEHLDRMSRSARKFAEEHLDIARFEKLLADVVGRVHEQGKRY